ncbi:MULTISPECIES: flagellar protein export ATPase FliI [Paraburkholderia]|uniref:flagellar protein export ATPase FliI n=1 Tax=Paraburkholderia TaxID=1822464 RepID=UPI0015C576F4|nr:MULTISPECIES: flagellar protein export ATPase FliI [Paraburkholderia]MCX4172043.1 flagellar protein export ATPase FliI [Paraburkholderia madseniana]MDQ6460052.1 flagellar protein export ATPase FliI [Paraburkholderia madseniana]NPT67746.1 flagellar protein export ATPase FliI [Paraburkholderia madseniana]
MVKPTLEEIRASDLTPLERELALASFGAEALADVPAAVTPAAAAVAAIDAALRDPAHGHPGARHQAKGAAASRESSAARRESADSSSPASPPPAAAPYDPALDSNPHMQAWRGRLDALRARNAIAKPMRACGRLTRAAGLVLEAVGLRLSVGAEVMIELPFGSSLAMAEAEVVGFSGDKLFLMPTTEVIGLLPGARVYPLESAPIADPMAGAKRLPVGWELLGRVLDASGRPLDGLGPLGAHADAPLSSPVINPLNREPIHKVLDVGVRAINALLTVGRGQRMGLFAGSGVGKSVLLGTMARYTSAEVIVIGLIGERGREVKEFIEQILGEEGLARSVVIAAPADVSPLLRMQAASYSTSLAEYFRDQGKHVLLLMDSLTRYAMAQREIALAVGEPPATKGYPPSVFAKLPALVERTGNGPAGGGSITAFYTVLTEGDDQQDPIADSARAILDGHIVLSRSLAEAGHYPAIDIEASISRAMTALIDDNHLEKTRMFKQMLSRYQRNRDLINVGAYSSGRDALLDRAIALYPRMEAFLQQGFRECAHFEPSLEMLDALFAQGG